MNKCNTCAYFDHAGGAASGGSSWGQCRRAPPTLHPVNVKSYMIEGVWPHVREDDWCGQWTSQVRSTRVETAAAARLDPAVAARLEAAAAARVEAGVARMEAAARPGARPSMLMPLPGGTAAGNGAAAPLAAVARGGD